MHPLLDFTVPDGYGLASNTKCSSHGLRTNQKQPRARVIHARVLIQGRRGDIDGSISYRMVVNFGGSHFLRYGISTVIEQAVRG